VPDGTESNRPPADTTLSQFSIQRDTQWLIPYIQAALTVNPNLRLWASPWTPPVWMKTGYKTNSGAPSGGNAVRPSYYDGGYMKSDTTTLNAHAQYFVKFLQAYQARGINIETIAPQNEPNYDQNYPSCLWDTATYTNFVKILAPALAAASLDTKIILGTMSNANSDPAIVTAVMGDSTASALVSSIGVQWGMTANIASYRSSYGLPVWVTEHRCGNYPWQTSTYVSERAPNDQAYAVESWGYIRDAIKAGVTAYNAWNMVLDPVGKGIDTSRDWAQNALLVVENGTLVRTPAYYVFRHVSQYVQPGALVVGTSGAGASDALAFKNPDGSIVAVVYNSGAARSAIVQIAGRKLQFNSPANGWATIVAQ
jgi:glucosylceramidase